MYVYRVKSIVGKNIYKKFSVTVVLHIEGRYPNFFSIFVIIC